MVKDADTTRYTSPLFCVLNILLFTNKSDMNMKRGKEEMALHETFFL